MHRHAITERGWTRRGLLGAAGGAAAGAVVVAQGGGASSLAQPSTAMDVRILNLLLLLERVQQDFYRVALERNVLQGELLEFAAAASDQESAHVRFLVRRLGDRAAEPPRTHFAPAASSPRVFIDAAVALEEAAIAAYIGQSPSLSRTAVPGVAVLVSVEARQAAWIRDLAGLSPAPVVADPARPASAVLAELRRKGWLA
jgi:Ferritin-like domain